MDDYRGELDLPWKRGIGNDCHKIWDAHGHLVATMENCADSTFIVAAANAQQEAKWQPTSRS